MLIVIGVGLPLVCLPLAEGYKSQAGIIGNIQQMQIPTSEDKHYRYSIDFRYFVSAGVLTVFAGLLVVVLGATKKKGAETKNESRTK